MTTASASSMWRYRVRQALPVTPASLGCALVMSVHCRHMAWEWMTPCAAMSMRQNIPIQDQCTGCGQFCKTSNFLLKSFFMYFTVLVFYGVLLLCSML